MVNKAKCWQDQEIYYAVIDTPEGCIWRLFSFDYGLTKEEMIQQITDFFPGAISVRNLDNWGTAYSLTPTLMKQPNAHLIDIEQQLREIQQQVSSDKSTLYRDLMDELELTYETLIFAKDETLLVSPEATLYAKVKNARDLAFLEESTQAY